MHTHNQLPADPGEADIDDEEEVVSGWHDLNPQLRRSYRDVSAELEEATAANDTARVRRLKRRLDRIGAEFFELNKGLVLASSRRFRAAAGSDKDYEAAGNLGFWEAFLRWDPDRGVKFSTFSRQYISGRVLRSVRTEEFKDLTQSEFGLRDKVRKEQARLNTDLERGVSTAELAEALEVPVSKIEKIMGPRDVSLSTPVGDGSATIGDLVSSKEDQVMIDDSVVDMDEFLADLSDLEFWVIQERSGMLGDDVQSLVEVADTIGIGREVARRAETRARVRAAATQLRALLGREPTVAEIGKLTGQDDERVVEFMASSWRDLHARYVRLTGAYDTAASCGDDAGETFIQSGINRLGQDFFREAAELAADVGQRFVDDEGEPIGTVGAARLIWQAFHVWDPSGDPFPTWARKHVAVTARRSRDAAAPDLIRPDVLWRLVNPTRSRSGS